MKNFSVITNLRLALLRNSQIEGKTFSKIRQSLILRPGYHFNVIDGIKPQSCSFEESEKTSDAGPYFEKKLKFEISKLRPEISELLNKYVGNMIIALITDANGYSWLIYPLSITRKRNLPGTAKGANETEVTLSGKWTNETPSVEIDL